MRRPQALSYFGYFTAENQEIKKKGSLSIQKFKLIEDGK
jgi:hypothetical protein